ncbi:hypothetical protein GCK72_026290 [Caenorhabditis remanei]|uniref:Uncharacterized protein n=1 Tax=Caenorhabditis remanei TaxID=31234 RepID=A0A6A5G509_CAERE|nr:hypothetical protein GCK72_026290 [Caenorhabditis remanei]KAF1749821.1 hypothetical protein GCK72_026290 [Caenorhabditis remanei]
MSAGAYGLARASTDSLKSSAAVVVALVATGAWCGAVTASTGTVASSASWCGESLSDIGAAMVSTEAYELAVVSTGTVAASLVRAALNAILAFFSRYSSKIDVKTITAVKDVPVPSETTASPYAVETPAGDIPCGRTCDDKENGFYLLINCLLHRTYHPSAVSCSTPFR